MNTPTLFLFILVTCGVIISLVASITIIIKAPTKTDRVFGFTVFFGILLVGTFCIIVALNAFGYGRLPLINEITKRFPDEPAPAIKYVPPTNGSSQPSSKPAIDEHKERMDKLKRNGF